MFVPAFADIGKATKDLIGKDFPIGSSKLEINTTAPNGLKLTVNGAKEGGSIASSIKAKYSDKASGITVTETLTNNNVLTTEAEMTDAIFKGLKIDFSGNLSGANAAKVGFEYKDEQSITRSSLDFFKSTLLNADSAFRYQDFVVGGSVVFNSAVPRLEKYSLAGAYLAPSFSASLLAGNNLSNFTASFHQKVNSDVEAAARAVWSRGASAVKMEVAAKLALDRDSFVKAKIDNDGNLGLGYTFKLANGVKLAIGGLFDATRLLSDINNVGVHITFEG